MGLSNEERLSKLYWGITHIRELVAEIEDPRENYDLPMELPERLERLRAVSDKLWYVFIGNHTNGAFWILGGELGNPVKGPNGPWGAAIASLCDEHRKDPSVYRPDRSKLPFDPFDGYLDVPGLLGQAEGGKTRKAIYNIYGWTEFLSYALRRYSDKLRRGLAELDKAVADIQGECFGIFAKDELYGRAYVLNRILEALYGGRYGKDNDLVRKVFLKLNMHHDLSRPMRPGCSLADVIEFDKWRMTHEPTPHNRVLLALRLAGRRFHYDHQFKALKAGLKDVKPKPRWERIEREFEKCKKAHADKESEGTNDYRERSDMDAAMVIHGYHAYDWMEKTKQTAQPKPPASSSGNTSDTDDE